MRVVRILLQKQLELVIIEQHNNEKAHNQPILEIQIQTTEQILQIEVLTKTDQVHKTERTHRKDQVHRTDHLAEADQVRQQEVVDGKMSKIINSINNKF